MRRRQVLKLLTLGMSLALGGFQVASAAPKDSVRFLAVADTGSGNAHQLAVGAQMAAVHRQRPVDLVVLGGDNIYPSGDLALVEATFLRPYAGLLAAKVPFHAVLGNHDIRTANGDPQVAYKPFGMNGRFYSLRRGDLELFMLDTNVNTDWAAQLRWLRSALGTSKAPWKVVIGHHPIYSSGMYGNDPDLRSRIAPLMQRYGVQLYINGHEHNYERSRAIDGITYLVVGGGGAALRPIHATDQSARALSEYSFAEIEAGPKELSVMTWNSKGELIDRAVIARR
jgi:3',5'-cyclic AMP phosphodiesterase CpdA